MSELEKRARKECVEWLAQKARQYRQLAIRHMYDNPSRHNELVREARMYDLAKGLIEEK